MMTVLQPPNVKAELILLSVQPARTRTEPTPHSWRHNNTHDPVCRWTLTFNEFNETTQANGDGSFVRRHIVMVLGVRRSILSLFWPYDLFLCKYYEIPLLLLEIFLVLGSCLIILVPFSCPVCPSVISVLSSSFCAPSKTCRHVCLFLVPVLSLRVIFWVSVCALVPVLF